MTFDHLKLKETYDSDEDDILNDFYIPVLSESRNYDRLAGYFSSSTLSTSAKGMANFIRNGGKMRLVTCVQISPQDYQAINDGITKPDEVISKIILSELDIADKLQKDHVAALAWMIAKGNLEIKIAIPFKNDGGFITHALDKNSIYHQKIGILHDDSNKIITFSGSINETGKAWIGNIEEFKVFCSWKAGQDVYGSSDARKFEKFWYNKSKNTKVVDLPTAVKDNLITNAAKSEDEAIRKLGNIETDHPILRDYQDDAIKKWFENDKSGIFEMATGTGKTWAAIACIKKLIDESTERNLIVIACPYKHLIPQWKAELKKWNIKSISTHDYHSSWNINIGNYVLSLNDDVIKNMVLVTTHDTFSNKKFIDIINLCKTKLTVVVDEVHKIGAKKRSEGLLDKYDFRLGLSATPERYFDDLGTKQIFDFFSNIIFKFGLSEAIEEGYLAHYLFFPHIVYLTGDETDQYHKFSKMIAIEASKELPDHEKIKRYLFNRSKVIKSAENKLAKFREIIVNNDKLDHCLIYCIDTKQLKNTSSILHDLGITYHRFTEIEDMDLRKKLLDEFSRGDKDVLVAVKCLDEGVDVPSTRMAIILASSHNPVEFVQRRGRILRTFVGKKHAIIHDLIVFPRSIPAGEIYTKSEKKIVEKEFERLEEFASLSDNPEYSQELVKTFKEGYDLEV